MRTIVDVALDYNRTDRFKTEDPVSLLLNEVKKDASLLTNISNDSELLKDLIYWALNRAKNIYNSEVNRTVPSYIGLTREEAVDIKNTGSNICKRMDKQREIGNKRYEDNLKRKMMLSVAWGTTKWADVDRDFAMDKALQAARSGDGDYRVAYRLLFVGRELATMPEGSTANDMDYKKLNEIESAALTTPIELVQKQLNDYKQNCAKAA